MQGLGKKRASRAGVGKEFFGKEKFSSHRNGQLKAFYLPSKTYINGIRSSEVLLIGSNERKKAVY